MGFGVPRLNMKAVRWEPDKPRLGRDVTVVQFPGGLHDLVLSKQEIREAVSAKLYPWLRARFP